MDRTRSQRPTHRLVRDWCDMFRLLLAQRTAPHHPGDRGRGPTESKVLGPVFRIDLKDIYLGHQSLIRTAAQAGQDKNVIWKVNFIIDSINFWTNMNNSNGFLVWFLYFKKPNESVIASTSNYFKIQSGKNGNQESTVWFLS